MMDTQNLLICPDNTLNYKQPTILEAGESGIYKINYLTDGMDHLRLFMVKMGRSKNSHVI